MEKKNHTLMIVDMSSFIFRAFYAIRPLTSPQGEPVNAVYGVFAMLLKILEEYKPTHLFLARDSREGSARKEIYPDYKANRSAPPEDLIPQFAMVEKLITLMNIPHLSLPRHEADDLIGSAIIQWSDQFQKIYIASSDKDLMQFVGKHVWMVDTKLEKIYGVEEVVEKMGVRPDQIVDFLSLVGDSSDNIPGVAGIGAKGAQKLLQQFSSLEECFKNKEKVANKKLQTALNEGEEMAYLSKKLVEIKVDLPLPDEKNVTYNLSPNQELIDYLHYLGFKSQVKRLQEMKGDHLETHKTKKPSQPEKLFAVQNMNDLQMALQKLSSFPHLFLSTHYEKKSMSKQKLLGLAITGDGEHLFYSTGELIAGLEEGWWAFIQSKGWIGENIKDDLIYLKVRGHWRKESSFSTFDLGVAHYLVNVDRQHTLDIMAQNYLHKELPPMIEDDIVASLTERAKVAYSLWPILQEELHAKNLMKLYLEIDNPLIPILAQMEFLGVLIDSPYFEQLAHQFEEELREIERKVAQSAECEVNLRSPKQVSELLFQKLALPVIQETKTQYSTNQEVLEELVAMKLSDIPGWILRYRELDKLYSTYVNVFPSLVDPFDGRLHSQFNLTVTATGRLSSEHPNLQNIPVRTEEGRKIRKGVLAPNGYQLLSADYSQIELRILAHFSEDPIMMKAFQQNLDIHTHTASEIFNKSAEEISSEERGVAKTINFALMYGQSSFGLSQTLKITRKAAREYIERYFDRFSSVKAYLDQLKEICRQSGYSETLMGRKRFIAEINSRNHAVRSNGERLAINSPIQGTNADLIKMAMLKIDQKIGQQKLGSRLILQIHDELIFEVPHEEVHEMQILVKNEMEGIVQLKVPLKVDMAVGATWYDLK